MSAPSLPNAFRPPETSPPSITETAGAFAETVRAHTSYVLANVRTFVETRSTTFWIVFGLAVAVLLGILIYNVVVFFYLWNRYINCPGCYLRYADENANVIERPPIAARMLTQPQNGYSYSMWVYVANWYNRNAYNKWKPLYVRADIPEGCGELEWDKVPYQQPGIWLAPNQNYIRVVVTTSAYAPSCDGDAAGDAAAGDAAAESFVDAAGSGQCSVPDLTTPGYNTNILEYTDLYDFPIGQWFQLSVCVTTQRIEVYMNGKLARTHVLVGACDMHNDNCTPQQGYFAPGDVHFTARLTNFRYMPLMLPAEMVQLLHEVEAKNPVLDAPNPLNPVSGGEEMYD